MKITEAATEKQIERLAAHGILANRAYSKKTATKLISEQKAPPLWKWAEEKAALVASAKAKSIEAEVKRIESAIEKGKLDPDAEYELYPSLTAYLEERREEAELFREEAEDIREDEKMWREDEKEFTKYYQELVFEGFGDVIKKPTQKQVADCLEALHAHDQAWEETHGLEALASTLLANYPELQRKGKEDTGTKGSGSCLFVLGGLAAITATVAGGLLAMWR